MEVEVMACCLRSREAPLDAGVDRLQFLDFAWSHIEHQLVADADLDNASEALNVAEGRARDVHLGSKKVLDRAVLPVREHGADARARVDEAVRADSSQRLAY